jgi:hypothetical protein
METKKMEMLMMVALSNYQAPDATKHRNWSEAIKKVWTGFLSSAFGVDIEEKTQKDMDLMNFYEQVVKPSRLKVFRDKMGGLKLDGLKTLFK